MSGFDATGGIGTLTDDSFNEEFSSSLGWDVRTGVLPLSLFFRCILLSLPGDLENNGVPKSEFLLMSACPFVKDLINLIPLSTMLFEVYLGLLSLLAGRGSWTELN